MIDRRGFVLGAAGDVLAVTAPAAAGGPVYVTTGRARGGGFVLVFLDAAGAVLSTQALDGRGHDIAVAPDGGRVVAFARRPGRFAVVADCRRGTAVQTIAAAANRHFCGHGFFSGDGRLLYATENAFDIEAGVIGVYDAYNGYKRIAEFPTGGIGPHEALLMPDGRTVAVANGGILTHPDFGRQKLNLATMEPSLAYLDRKTGEIVDRVRLSPDHHRLSIRHLGLDRSGAVWFGCQNEGAASDQVPLVGRHVPGGTPQLIAAPDAVTRSFRNYIGAVAANRSGTRIATTSPRGGVLVIWDAASEKVVATTTEGDVCGVAAHGLGGFVASSGGGEVLWPDGTRRRNAEHAWDNHMRRL